MEDVSFFFKWSFGVRKGVCRLKIKSHRDLNPAAAGRRSLAHPRACAFPTVTSFLLHYSNFRFRAHTYLSAIKAKFCTTLKFTAIRFIIFTKTQLENLITLREVKYGLINNVQLQFSDSMTHLGHLLSYNLNDKDDIIRVVKDLNRKANSLL